MVSPETEAKLAKIFINLAKGERKAEVSRQVLGENPDFNSFQLFKLLDKENKNYIDSTSIVNFLTSKGISLDNNEAQLLILFYDLNYDGVLSYNEFINLIENKRSPQDLSNLNINNINNINNSSNIPLSFNISYSFLKLFEKEIELARKIILLLNDIRSDKNFDIHELYHKVKISNFINEDGIKNFLDKNNEYFLDSDIIAILKRLDLNKDGKVDLCEFHAFLGFPKCYYCCPCMRCSHCGTCYCNICFCKCHCNYHKRTHRSYNSPSKYKNDNDLERNNYDNEMNFNPNNDLINKNLEIENNYNNIDNNNYYNRNNINNINNIDNIQDDNNYNYNLDNNINDKYNNNYNNDEIDNNYNKYNNYNYKGLNMKTKQILENKNNYNYNIPNEERQPRYNKEINYNYSPINDDNNNIDIKKVSKSLHIRPSPERKYGKKKYNLNDNNYNPNNNKFNNNNINNINNINYFNGRNENKNNSRSYNLNEENEYQQDQNNNENNYDFKPYNQNEYEENQFNEFIKQIMLAEGEIEKIKVNLALRPDFNCEDCFRIFELDGKGKLYPEDIKEGLNLIGVFYSDFEIDLFFKRFDLQKKGYINYSDFFDIFVPFQKEFRSIVEDRKPNSCCPCRCPDIFCPETISILKNLMDNIIKHENNFNFLRRGFTTLNLKLKNIFENIDILKMGYFTNNDLIVYLKKNRIFNTNLDADLLFIRLDKNRNGKIDYQEIYDETHPLYNLN